MKQMRTQPYFKYAMDRLPADTALDNAVAEYLGVRLTKNPTLSVKLWEACIDELVDNVHIVVPTVGRGKRRVAVKARLNLTVADVVYMFQVAASRGWNHVYFTQKHDAEWANMSYYQDPYWQKSLRESRKILEEELNGRD